MFAWFHCWRKSHHNPARHPLGGFRCVDCGAMGIDLGEMGFTELGALPTRRKLFSRDPYVSSARSTH